MDKEALKQAMQQAQTMQVDLVRAQEELAKTSIEGHSNDGKVKITMTANGDFQKVSIDPGSLVEGIGKLEKDVLEALNDSTHKAAELTKTRLQEISGQIGL